MTPTTRSVRFRPSTLLSGLTWETAPARFPGTQSDMHWAMWSGDGDVYTVDDDGRNFGSPWNFAQLMRVTGTPPHHEVSLVTQFPELKRSGNMRCQRYVDGAIAVGERLHVTVYDYDDDVPGFEDEWEIVDRISPHGGVAGIMYSDDAGRTWNNVPPPSLGPDDYFLGPRFAGLAFVGFGPGSTGIPARFGDYAYAISNDVNWETGDHVFLARVPLDSVTDRSRWEFFASHGEGASPIDEPVWSPREDRARPVLRDPGRIGHPTMTYVPALERFLLTYSTDPVPHTFNTPREVALSTWDQRTELLVLEGPTPWGPWGLVHHEPEWDAPHTPYLPQVPGKWLDEDGLGGWMIHSGDYVIPNEQGDYYGFMTRRFRLHR
jgi:hypothetical protein